MPVVNAVVTCTPSLFIRSVVDDADWAMATAHVAVAATARSIRMASLLDSRHVALRNAVLEIECV